MEEKWEEYMHTHAYPLVPAERRDEFHAQIAHLHDALRRGDLPLACSSLGVVTADSAEVSPACTGRRAMFMYHVSPAIPTPAVLAEIGRFLTPASRLLEVGAHRGVWGRLCAMATGCAVTSVHKDTMAYSRTLGDVWRVESPPSFVQGAHDRYDSLLLVAPQAQPATTKDGPACVRAFGGRFVFHVHPDSAVADETTQAIEERFKNVGGCALPPWGNARDWLHVYERRVAPLVQISKVGEQM